MRFALAVQVIGDETEMVFGEKGDPGPTGLPGAKGEPGEQGKGWGFGRFP